jgi:pimeloyl-ACP methyl ester carboxylesterase
MLTAETLPAEGARYAASIVCVPGLWAQAAVWRGFASYLAHRGWECHLLEVRDVGGGVEARATAVAEYTAELSLPAILIGHDGGAPIALAAARRRPPRALVLLAPLVPESRGARLLTRAPRSLLALISGRPVPPPAGPTAKPWLDLPEPAAAGVRAFLAPDDAASVREVAWGRLRLTPASGPPALLVAGANDRLLPPAAAEPLARTLGAELRMVAGAGHWLLAGPGWQDTVALVHRWLVQRLGAPLLELYEEAMAEREADDEGSE